jgi:hypothetical protein
MVVKRSLLPAVSMGLVLLMAAASPVMGIYRGSKPDPLVQQSLVRVHDMAAAPKTSAYGAVVAAGWRQDAKPGQLWVTYSTDGGHSYLRNASVLRKFRVAGDGQRGLSLDICGGRIWVASVANYPGDDAANRDVLLTSRTINGTTAAQAFVTQSSVDRLVSDVALTCVGKKLLAVAWLEESFGKSRAKLLVRSLEPLGEPSKVRKVWGLGDALRKGGISVDASTDAIQVAWTNGAAQDLYVSRFTVTSGQEPVIKRRATQKLATADVIHPQVAARGLNAVVTYTDAGKIKAQVSGDNGVTWGEPSMVIGTGTINKPSRVHAADIAGGRIVVEATASQAGTQSPTRVQSTDSGVTWGSRTFGHVGARVGALLKDTATTSLLMEAWQNNAPGLDTLRAQYER